MLSILEREHLNAPLIAAPVSKRDVRPLKVRKVDVRRNCPPDNEVVRVIIDDVKMAVAPLDVDWPRNQKFCRKQPKRHVHSPLPTVPQYAEQLWIGAWPNDSGNALTRIKFDFRPTADLFRRTEAETFRIGAA